MAHDISAELPVRFENAPDQAIILAAIWTAWGTVRGPAPLGTSDGHAAEDQPDLPLKAPSMPDGRDHE